MGVVEARYYMEHELLPELFFEDKGDFLDALLDDEQNLLYNCAVSVFEEEGIECPYSENQFTCRLRETDNGYFVIKITLPQPEKQLLCSQIYLVFDATFDEMHYVTIELDSMTRKRRVYFLGEWDAEQHHYNYGQAPNGVIEQEKMIEKIFC